MEGVVGGWWHDLGIYGNFLKIKEEKRHVCDCVCVCVCVFVCVCVCVCDCVCVCVCV